MKVEWIEGCNDKQSVFSLCFSRTRADELLRAALSDFLCLSFYLAVSLSLSRSAARTFHFICSSLVFSSTAGKRTRANAHSLILQRTPFGFETPSNLLLTAYTEQPTLLRKLALPAIPRYFRMTH